MTTTTRLPAVICTALLLLAARSQAFQQPYPGCTKVAFQQSSISRSSSSAVPSVVLLRQPSPSLHPFPSRTAPSLRPRSSSSSSSITGLKSYRITVISKDDVFPDDGSNDSESKEGRIFEEPFRGIVRDISLRAPHLLSDITDGINLQCVAATLFLFFACLAPAIGFGGLFGVATNGAIGTVEMVSSTAACGILYALFSAQPMTIIGSTGPVLAFVACLTQLAQIWKVPFLPLYAWTGLWTSGILLIASITSASNLVRYLTRFTDEIFSTLISTIFIVEAISDVAQTFTVTSPANTALTKALLTLVTASTTFVVASALKNVRRTSFFWKPVRNAIANFGPTIGVVAGAWVARWARLTHGAYRAGLPALSMPLKFGTTSGRPWLIPLWDLPLWARWAALLPAIMATVLLFLDQNITVRLVNNPRWKMRKGRKSSSDVLGGMHLDLFVIALLTAAQSLVGLPWLVAATVRSLSHVGALSKYDAETGNVDGTIEQRLTGVSVHALIGCCVLLAKPRSLLAQIPLPVLMGLFMYLGVSSLPGNEMWERILGLFKDKSVAPKQRWTGTVPNKVVNGFTLLQVVCLGAMFWVKESSIGVLFPVIIALLAPIRFGLEKFGIIKKEYVDILDSDEDE